MGEAILSISAIIFVLTIPFALIFAESERSVKITKAIIILAFIGMVVGAAMFEHEI